MSDAVFQVTSAQQVAVRPLDKGVFKDRSGQAIPQGGFVELLNYRAGPEGPKKRGGWTLLVPVAATPFLYDALDMVVVWGKNGVQIPAVLSTKTLAKVSMSGGLTEKSWKYSTGTASGGSGSTAVTGVGTLWNTAASDVKKGDVFRVGTEEATIKQINSDTSLDLDTAITAAFSGSTYGIERSFYGKSTDYLNICAVPDSATMQNCLIVADGKRPLKKYDPYADTWGYWGSAAKSPGGVDLIPAAVTVYGNRVWVANVYNSVDSYQRQRIWFSTIADTTDFSTATNYIDLPYTQGAIRRLVPMGAYLIAYLDDAVYIGTPTNNSLLPVRFDLIDTGGIGPIGARAVCSYLGGHFMVGRDDVYLVTPQGAERIGSSVIKSTLASCQYPQRVYAVPDPLRSRVVFGFPQSNDKIETIWSWDYRTKAWSQEDADASMLALPIINQSVTWDTLGGTWDTLSYPTWDSISGAFSAASIVCGRSTNLYIESETLGTDFGSASAYTSRIVTPDFDFDQPDVNKIWTRFSMKIDWELPPSGSVDYLVECSTNHGRTWKFCGDLSIPVGKDEGFVTFQTMGSGCRFRLTTASNVGSYWIAEYGLRVRAGGQELSLGASQ